MRLGPCAGNANLAAENTLRRRDGLSEVTT